MRTLSVRPQSYSTLPILIRPGRRESYEDGRGATQLVTQIRQCSSEPNPFSRDTFHKCSPDQKAILTFWFGSQFPNEIPEGQGERWFIGTPELNAEIIAKFKGLVQQAVDHKLDGWWAEGAHQCLALIILLDQFSMNIARERKDAYGFLASAQAVPFAYSAIGRGYLDNCPPACRLFFLLPLMHSENMSDQDKCVEMHEKYGMPVGWAQRHRDAVAKFGRFPNRNAAYGRESTPEEEEYLKTFAGWG